MKDRVFVDTNVLIYLYSEDEPEKRERTKDPFIKYHCVTSIQVLNELSNVMIKKFRINPTIVLEVVNEIIENCEFSLIDLNTVKKALNILEKYKYSYYDCLIIASALENECNLLLTEDMQNGQTIEGYLTIMNIY